MVAVRDTGVGRPGLPPNDLHGTPGPLTGQSFSRYKVLSLLAPGQSEKVYKARDNRDGKIVAFKVLGQEYSHSPDCFHRFLRAVRIVVGLQHENIVQVYEASAEPQSLCWIATEYVDGESLTRVIRRIGPANMLDWCYTFNVAVHIVRPSKFAHDRHLIHRNITPASILVRRVDNVAKLNYLILAKATEGMPSRQATRAGELPGDLHFMSPERTFGEERIDARSDIYSLGATLYAMLAGRPPFQGLFARQHHRPDP